MPERKRGTALAIIGVVASLLFGTGGGCLIGYQQALLPEGNSIDLFIGGGLIGLLVGAVVAGLIIWRYLVQ
jgi:hypothetical protein